MNSFFDLVFHIDQHLHSVIETFGIWSYLLLFLIIFAETGLVITPFLPGDSLLFACGALAAVGSLDIGRLFLFVLIAAIAGDSLNYAVGKTIGGNMLRNNSRFLKKEYLERTRHFYEKYGGKTIVLARFIPIVRTFAPFVAGVGTMNYPSFALYNVIGGLLWTGVFVLGGFFFGNVPIIKNNFAVAIFVIILLSILPAGVELWKHRGRSR